MLLNYDYFHSGAYGDDNRIGHIPLQAPSAAPIQPSNKAAIMGVWKRREQQSSSNMAGPAIDSSPFPPDRGIGSLRHWVHIHNSKSHFK